MTNGTSKKRVLAIVANVKQFRLPFYSQLAQALAQSGIELRVVYSDPEAGEALKGDSIDLPESIGQKAARIYLLRRRALLQFVPLSLLFRADLVIIVQANGYLLNYAMLLASWLGLKRVAFWGHGYNHQGRLDAWQERFRRMILCGTDWWFAYTGRTADYLKAQGVEASRITVINNAVDTKAFAEAVVRVSPEEEQALRRELCLGEDTKIALYCGSLYAHKCIPLLLGASSRVASVLGDFALVVMGAGPDEELVRTAARNQRWVRYMGPHFGRKKAVAFRCASLFVNPGLVGLAILDSFAAGLPLVTTDVPVHSPEIAYLESGFNGLMVAHDEAAYANALVTLIRDPGRLAEMSRYALASAERFTVERMVDNVAGGVAKCLGVSRPENAPGNSP